MTAEQRVRLRDVLPQTASWAEVDAAGGLAVELYDFSAAAHHALGNDVAFILRLDAAGTADVLDRLATQPLPETPAERRTTLLALLAERFADYYAVRRWLDAQRIPYHTEFEPWA